MRECESRISLPAFAALRRALDPGYGRLRQRAAEQIEQPLPMALGGGLDVVRAVGKYEAVPHAGIDLDREPGSRLLKRDPHGLDLCRRREVILFAEAEINLAPDLAGQQVRAVGLVGCQENAVVRRRGGDALGI